MTSAPDSKVEMDALPSSPQNVYSQSSSPTVVNTPSPSEDKVFLPPGGDALALDAKLSDASTALADAEKSGAKAQSKTSDTVTAIQDKLETGQDYATVAKPLASNDPLKVIGDDVSHLADYWPTCLKVLDEITKIHPFISIAVEAFRVAVELDLKRRGNDKKISVLLLEMRYMMDALMPMKDLASEACTPEGMTIEEHMQTLIRDTADDIKACANACDAYSKKKVLAKVLKSVAWDKKLQTYLSAFAKRRDEFTLILALYAGAGINVVHRGVEAIHDKLDVVLEYFHDAVSDEQRVLNAIVERNGGPTAIMKNDEALKDLIQTKRSTRLRGRHSDQGDAQRRRRVVGDDLLELKDELFESPDVAIRNNWDIFERKYKMQQRELAEELRRTIRHEGDRMIDAVTAGPHDKIIDGDIHNIWEEMRWRGNVKTRHFVLALRDYYREQHEKQHQRTGGTGGDMGHLQDEWALEYINVNRLQAISEAFDDDASGFITLWEVNEFTASRPQEWSLLRWLAYWAVGWQMAATHYRDKIEELVAKMFSIRSQILHANRHHVDEYLHATCEKMTKLVESFVPNKQTSVLWDRFRDYVEAEEDRLKGWLEHFRYDIDAMDTLRLITGPGRIEKFAYPLLYLLLRRDFEIFRLARTKILHKDELWDSAGTIEWVFDAISLRHNELEALFKQQNLDPAQQFKNFASEMFNDWHACERTLESLKKKEFMEVEYVDANEDQNVDPATILNYPIAADDLFVARGDEVVELYPGVGDAVKPLIGRWHGWIGTTERFPIKPMFTIIFHATEDPQAFKIAGALPSGIRFAGQGNVAAEESGEVRYTFNAFLHQSVSHPGPNHFVGTISEEGRSFTGSWGDDAESMNNTFYLSRIAPELLIARPPPADFEAGRIKALWKYALAAARNQARRNMYAWSHFRERRYNRFAYLALCASERAKAQSTLNEDSALDQWAALYRTCTYQDIQAFYVINGLRQGSVVTHPAYCDACHHNIRGARLICLECGVNSTLDFHDKEPCRSSSVLVRDDLDEPHLPTHDMFKLRRTIVFYRDIGGIMRHSAEGLARARKLLEKDRHPARRPQHGGRRASTAAGHPKKLACVLCKGAVLQPCFFCIDCMPDDVFICADCDERHGGFSAGNHKDLHTLVRCIDPPSSIQESHDDDDSSIKALLETRFLALERAMESRLTTLESAVEMAVENKLAALESRFASMEKMLEMLLATRS